MTLDQVLAVVQPHTDKLVAEAKLENARRALERVYGELHAARVQRSPKDDAIIGEHIDTAYEAARAALGFSH